MWPKSNFFMQYLCLRKAAGKLSLILKQMRRKLWKRCDNKLNVIDIENWWFHATSTHFDINIENWCGFNSLWEKSNSSRPDSRRVVRRYLSLAHFTFIIEPTTSSTSLYPHHPIVILPRPTHCDILLRRIHIFTMMVGNIIQRWSGWGIIGQVKLPVQELCRCRRSRVPFSPKELPPVKVWWKTWDWVRSNN